MGIKKWRTVFSEINCLENLSDEPEDWKSDEACTLCQAASDVPQCEENNLQTAFTDLASSASPSGQTASAETAETALTNFVSSLPDQPPFGDYLDANNNQTNCSLASLLTSVTTTPMMTNSSSLIGDSKRLNSLNSLNSLNNLISTTDSMATNQNVGNADLPDIKMVSILLMHN